MGVLGERWRWVWAASAWALLLLATALPAQSGAQAQNLGNRLVVVVSAENPTRDISSSKLRAIFMGKPTRIAWGGTFIPLNHAARGELRMAFDNQFLGMGPDRVGRYWVDQRIRGRLRPPRIVPSLRMLKLLVTRLKQAISYMRADDLQPGLIPLKIDGVDFRAPNYHWVAAER